MMTPYSSQSDSDNDDDEEEEDDILSTVDNSTAPQHNERHIATTAV